MDEFALTHTSNSIPVRSIQWGALDIEGSMATSNHLKVTQSRGWGIVAPHIIHKTLDLIVCKKCPPVLLVSPVSPTVFTEKEKTSQKIDLVYSLLAQTPSQRKTYIKTHIFQKNTEFCVLIVKKIVQLIHHG